MAVVKKSLAVEEKIERAVQPSRERQLVRSEAIWLSGQCDISFFLAKSQENS
jgi:hypothetical protein